MNEVCWALIPVIPVVLIFLYIILDNAHQQSKNQELDRIFSDDYRDN